MPKSQEARGDGGGDDRVCGPGARAAARSAAAGLLANTGDGRSK